jgi:AmmeMemoRadiSam system protein B/AmmeMemoRadiSam system protein A
MCKVKYILLMITGLMLFSGCHSQENDDVELKNRKPVVAGQFYDADSGILYSNLQKLFAEAKPRQYENVKAVITPHAGYVFSGEVAASSFNQLDPETSFDNVFILASSHRISFDGASIYNLGHYETPLGLVKVNLDLAGELIGQHSVFTFRSDAHSAEHSLEVQLPFLQYRLGKDFRIVPIVIGTQNPETCRSIADALKPYLLGNNLFVISTDFSHYPSYEDAVIIDNLTADAIVSKDPVVFLQTLDKNASRGIYNLATSCCGWSSTLSLLYMIHENPEYEVHKVQYKNSGDARYYGDKDRVVGYYSIVVTVPGNTGDDATGFNLSEKDKEDLLLVARNTINEYIRSDNMPDVDASGFSTALREHCGAFVSLYKDHRLRGCIGRFKVTEPLYKVVQQMAVASATQDYRFPRVEETEIEDLRIEISVLTPMRKIDSIDEIMMGKHGIYIKKGSASGTFLPQVGTQTGWTVEEFLGHCAQDKARIGWDGWKDAEVYVYEALVFGE